MSNPLRYYQQGTDSVPNRVQFIGDQPPPAGLWFIDPSVLKRMTAPGFDPRYVPISKPWDKMPPESGGRYFNPSAWVLLAQRGTDSVPAELTPKEAVLNRNAAELAGRQHIARLNAVGNALARRGVDLPTQRYQLGTSNVIADPDDPGLNINTPGQPGYVPKSSPLADIRARFANELKDPAIRTQLFNLTHREVGGQSPQAQQAFVETLFNRAITRNRTLSQTINDRNYYPASSYKPVTLYPDQQAHYGSLVDRVAQGSNVSNYATGNASGSVGFGGGPRTASYSGENFGIEKPDLNAMHLMGLQSGQYPTVPYAPTTAGATPSYSAGQETFAAGMAAQQASTPKEESTSMTVGKGLLDVGQNIQQQQQKVAKTAEARMAAAEANVPTSSPLLAQLGADPLGPLRQAIQMATGIPFSSTGGFGQGGGF
jgi:hypothetical protein